MKSLASLCLGLRAVFVLSAFLLPLPFQNQDAQALIFWSNSNGSAANFDWQNGGSENGLFGDPILVGTNTLVFSPSNFRAEALDGDSIFLSDRLEVELIAHSEFHFKGIAVYETGDYQIIGTGSVDVAGDLSVENMDTAAVLDAALITNPSMPVAAVDDFVSDTWEAAGQLDIESANWTRIKISLENDFLTITTGQGSIAWIEKKDVGNTIAIQIIPEPATLCMLGLGALSVIRRKK